MSMRLNRDELARTRAKLDKVNQRAAKRGFTGRFELSATPCTWSDVHGFTLHGFEVSLSGTAPCYEGWTFVAALDAVGDGVVVRRAPGTEDVALDAFTEAQNCEHCGTRRERKHTYVLVHADGSTKQVGKTCMKDFLGWDVHPVFLDVDEVANSVFATGEPAPEHDVVECARIVFAATEAFGFRPTSSDASTVSVLRDVLEPSTRTRELLEAMEGHMPTMEQTRERIAEVLADLGTEDGDYARNMCTVLRAESVGQRQFGLLASVGQCWQRIHNRRSRQDAEQKAAAEFGESKHLGAPNEHVQVKAVVKGTSVIEGYMPGTSRTVVRLDVDGNDAVVFTSARWARDLSEGQQVELKATIKELSHYRGRAETVLSYAKPVKEASHA